MKKLSQPLNAKALIDRLQTEDDREKVSLYLSKSLYEKFKKSCGKASASRVMEELMKDFLENLKSVK